MRIHEYLNVIDGEIRCRRCGHVLGPDDCNYKLGTLMIERPLQDANPYVGDAARYVDADVQLRQYVCPGCGVLLDNEVGRVGDPPIWDINVSTGA
jgi:acetone carboxylase gamma subunit